MNAEKQRTPIDAMLKPRSIAVIGASSREGSLGNMVMKKILDFGYKGDIYPVNPNSVEIFGLKVYSKPGDLPQGIDTAVICIPGQYVFDSISGLAERGIRSFIIISAGFRETGPEGVEREKKLAALAEETGIRILGPNCFGIINGSNEISLDCTFARNIAPRGYIGFISQSGAFGAAVNEDLRLTTMGLSIFISLGNRLDFDENEALVYLAADNNTKIILLYLENFADPVKFIETAQKITPLKPIIAIKSGRSSSGSKAAASHTGQLAQSDELTEAIFEKAGIIRVYSVDELIMAAKGLYSGILPEVGKKLAVITNAGGFGVMAIDKAEELGVELAEFTPRTIEYLKSNLPPEASCRNPVDLLGTATDAHYRAALKAVLEDPNVGGVVYNFGPPVMQKAGPIAQVAADLAPEYPHKPIFTVFMNRRRILEPIRALKDIYIPQFDYPEDAVWAFSKAWQYKEIKLRRHEDPPELDVDFKKANEIIKKAENESRNFLNFNECESVLKAYGIPAAPSIMIMSEDVAQNVPINFPVAVKPLWGGILHKTDLDAIRLNVATHEELKKSIREISENIGRYTGVIYDKGFVLQQMAKGATEVIIGAVKADCGVHLIMFGLGGIFVELLEDVAFSVPPVTYSEAAGMVERIKGVKLLKGYRKKSGVYIEDIIQVIIRVSKLVSDFPQIKEIDINPFMSFPDEGKSYAVDFRILF